MTTKQINEAIEETESMRMITEAFTEISSSKLKQIRATVERNRLFFDDLTNIYGLVNLLAVHKGVPLPIKNNKTLSVVITSNYRFYGKVNNDLMNFFHVQTSKINSEKIVIGRTGIEFLKGINYALSFQSVILEKDFPSEAELRSLGELVAKYAKVLIFHPKFKSVLIQQSVITDVTQTKENIDTKMNESKEQLDNYLHFILEPELPIIVNFFDAQIKTLLLEQTFLETELARTAARLMTMDSAQNEAKNTLKQQKISLSHAKKSITNSRILETIAALKLTRSQF